MRSTAKKVKIEDLVHGEYVQSPEGEPNLLITPWEEELLRVNIIATVVDKFVRDDGGYATLRLDDGSATIRAKAWSEGVEEMESFEVGDLVKVVGKVREYEGEVHLVPEIIKEVEDPNWELVWELEILENRKRMYSQGVRPEVKSEEPEQGESEPEMVSKSEETGSIEALGEPSNSEGEPQVSDKLKDRLLLALDKLEGEEGASIIDLAAEIDESQDKTETILGILLNEDKVYEPVAGKFKRLG